MGGGRSDHAFGGQHVVVARRAASRAVAPHPLRPLRRQPHVRGHLVRQRAVMRLPANVGLSSSTSPAAAGCATAPAGNGSTRSTRASSRPPPHRCARQRGGTRPARCTTDVHAKGARKTRAMGAQRAKAAPTASGTAHNKPTLNDDLYEGEKKLERCPPIPCTKRVLPSSLWRLPLRPSPSPLW